MEQQTKDCGPTNIQTLLGWIELRGSLEIAPHDHLNPGFGWYARVISYRDGSTLLRAEAGTPHGALALLCEQVF